MPLGRETGMNSLRSPGWVQTEVLQQVSFWLWSFAPTSKMADSIWILAHKGFQIIMI